MSAADRYAGHWLPAALSRIPRLRRQFDFNRDPYIRAQMRDMEKSETQRRDGRGSAMVRTDKAAVTYRPPPEIAKALDRENFNTRWMTELRDSVFAQAANGQARPEPKGPNHNRFQSPSQGRQPPQKETDMPDHIQINGQEHIHLNAVRRLRVVTEEERESLSKLGPHVDANRFNTRLDHPGGKKSYARETIDQIAAQGVPLVEVDQGAFVPANGIGKVRDITPEDRASFEGRTGRSLRADYKSRIETHAGMVLSTYDSATVMNRIGRPYQPRGGPSESAQGLAQQADAVMAQAAPAKSRSRGKQRQPDV